LNPSPAAVADVDTRCGGTSPLLYGNRPVIDEGRSVDHPPDIHTGADEDILIGDPVDIGQLF